jgi:hypothetical protein
MQISIENSIGHDQEQAICIKLELEDMEGRKCQRN